MKLITVDPGVHRTALATFDEGELVHAVLENVTKDGPLSVPHAAQVVIELPRSYPGSRQKGDQNDLIDLAQVVGRYAEAFRREGAEVALVYPRTWKGTLPKDVMVERIKGRLSAAEHARVELPSAASLAHNVYDAIGIGLHALGRLAPRKVIAR